MNLKMVNGKIFVISNDTLQLHKKVKYNRFLELCKMSITLEDLVPGFVCYEGGRMIIIDSVPFISKYTNSLFVEIIKECPTPRRISLSDHNIVNGGYNLYRIFADRDLSIEYTKLADSYSYWDKDDYGESCLCYSITPVSSPRMKIDPTKYEVK